MIASWNILFRKHIIYASGLFTTWLLCIFGDKVEILIAVNNLLCVVTCEYNTVFMFYVLVVMENDNGAELLMVYIYGLVQERHNSFANALELHFLLALTHRYVLTHEVELKSDFEHCGLIRENIFEIMIKNFLKTISKFVMSNVPTDGLACIWC